MFVTKGLVSKKSGGGGISFPDVCKTPAPPAPFVPIPYPNSQYQENLKKASDVDAKAANGNKVAAKVQQTAIKNLQKSVGDEAGTLKGVTTAVNAVHVGYTLHQAGIGKPKTSDKTSIEMGFLGRSVTGCRPAPTGHALGRAARC